MDYFLFAVFTYILSILVLAGSTMMGGKALRDFQTEDFVFCFCPVVNFAMLIVVVLGGLVMWTLGGFDKK